MHIYIYVCVIVMNKNYDDPTMRERYIYILCIYMQIMQTKTTSHDEPTIIHHCG